MPVAAVVKFVVAGQLELAVDSVVVAAAGLVAAVAGLVVAVAGLAVVVQLVAVAVSFVVHRIQRNFGSFLAAYPDTLLVVAAAEGGTFLGSD